MDAQDTIIQNLLLDIETKTETLFYHKAVLENNIKLVLEYNNRIDDYEKILQILNSSDPTMRITTPNGSHLLLNEEVPNYNTFKGFIFQALNTEINKLQDIIDGIPL